MAQLVKKPPAMREIPGLERLPWTRVRLPTPVFWPGEVHEVAKSQK